MEGILMQWFKRRNEMSIAAAEMKVKEQYCVFPLTSRPLTMSAFNLPSHSCSTFLPSALLFCIKRASIGSICTAVDLKRHESGIFCAYSCYPPERLIPTFTSFLFKRRRVLEERFKNLIFSSIIAPSARRKWSIPFAPLLAND